MPAKRHIDGRGERSIISHPPQIVVRCSNSIVLGRRFRLLGRQFLGRSSDTPRHRRVNHSGDQGGRTSSKTRTVYYQWPSTDKPSPQRRKGKRWTSCLPAREDDTRNTSSPVATPPISGYGLLLSDGNVMTQSVHLQGHGNLPLYQHHQQVYTSYRILLEFKGT